MSSKAATTVTRLTELPSPDNDRVGEAVAAACETAGDRTARTHVIFCDDEEISAVHGEFFDDPTPTDVITFPIEGDGSQAAPFVGEILVSVETAARIAGEINHSAENESLLYVVHGVLHLCGYRDITPEDRTEMRAAERVALQKLGVDLHYFE